MTAVLEGQAARRLGVFEVVQRGAVAVDQRGVARRPAMLGARQFRRIRWLEAPLEAPLEVFRHVQLGTGMPADAVEDEHDLLSGTGVALAACAKAASSASNSGSRSGGLAEQV